MTALHDKLVALQSDEELERKARKAASRGFWTQEDIDAARRRAERLFVSLKWDELDQPANATFEQSDKGAN